jgi:hypothetical protein
VKGRNEVFSTNGDRPAMEKREKAAYSSEKLILEINQ